MGMMMVAVMVVPMIMFMALILVPVHMVPVAYMDMVSGISRLAEHRTAFR